MLALRGNVQRHRAGEIAADAHRGRRVVLSGSDGPYALASLAESGAHGPEFALASLAEGGAPRLLAEMGTVSEEKSGAEILVRGRVQGVGFREFCVRAAERLGVVGYAMNLRDGRVRIVAEGTRTVLDAFVREVERGPRLARVEQTTVSWRAPSEPFTSFGIRYTGEDA